MNLVVISHKETWHDPSSPSGFSTVGGFPFQMKALSSLFDKTTLMVPIQQTAIPTGAVPITGHAMHFLPLTEPSGIEWKRKLNMLPWTVRHFPLLWREVRHADAVHTPVGGDIGTIGILIALLQRKPLFVRHCGTWGQPISWVDQLTQRGLEFIAGGHNVVLATGGSDVPPSKRNPHIAWIFSTSLTQQELEQASLARVWMPGETLRLITVGRLSKAKNVQSILYSLPLIKEKYPDIHLDILGDGEYRPTLENLASDLRLTESVTFYGNLNHKNVLLMLTQAHLFVFPSVREGFPKAVLEALACGLPVIATSTSVIPQLLKNGSGRLLEEPSVQSLVNVIQDLLTEPEKLAQMHQLAHETAKRYTLEEWTKTIEGHLCTAWGPLSTCTA